MPPSRPSRLPAPQEWLFALRTFAAAMAALGIGLWLDLPRPYWAMATVYIATQPYAGATLSKAAYRAIGTIGGGLAALILVPTLVASPELLSLALALWVGLCLFLALLDRTPRSYAFMLAGYSAAIIGFPSVTAPGAIFDTVLARVEEILLGIACATIAATIVFPRAAGPALAARIGAWLHDADRWAVDALAGRPEDTAYRLERRRLIAGIVEIDGIGASLAWDPLAGPGAATAMHTLRQEMLLLLPILSSVDDRVTGLHGEHRARAAKTLGAVAAWIRNGAPRNALEPLQTEIATLEDETKASPTWENSTWETLVLASLALRLRDYTSLRTAIALSQTRLSTTAPSQPEPPIPGAPPSLPFVQHRDAGMALLSATAAILAVLLCCLGWIATAWPDGATAAEMAAVVCSFFAQQDNPVPAIVSFLRWSIVAVIVDAVILFGILPMTSDFEMLVLAMAPAFILYGLLIARPATNGTGLALAANGGTLLGLQSAYSADFAAFANSGLALVLGMTIGAVVTALIRTVGASWAVRRLLRANWAAMAQAAKGYGAGDRETVAALMLDRVALMATRLTAVEPGSDVNQVNALAEIRIGMNLVELRRGRHGLPHTARATVDAALDALAHHFQDRAAGRSTTLPPTLIATIDAALAAVAPIARSDAQRSTLQGLVGIHRGLLTPPTLLAGIPPA